MELLQTGRLMLTGAFAFLAVVEIWFLMSRRVQRHLWGGLASALVVSFLMARYIAHSAADVSERIMALQVENAALFGLAAVGLQVIVHSTSGRWRTPIHVLAGWAVTMAGLCFVDGVVIDHAIRHVSGAFGTSWVTAPVTTLGWVLRGSFLLAFSAMLIAIGGELRDPGHRGQFRVARFAGVFVVVAVVSERLGAAGVLPTLALMEAGLASFGIALAVALAQYAEHAFQVLEADVEAQAEQLEDALGTLSGLLSALPNNVLVLREDSVQLFNPAAQQTWEAPAEARLSLSDICGSERDIVRLRRLWDSDGPQRARVRLTDASGRTFPCDVVAVRAMLDDEQVVIVDARDVSQREEMEQRIRLADRLGATGTLAAGIAHEINNPLTYISSNIAFVRDNLPAGSELAEALDDCASGVTRVTAIVRELRQFSGVDQSADETSTPLNRPLQFALRLTKHVLRHSCDVETRVADDLPAVEGDDGRLSQLFVNLLTHAGESMPEGRSAASNRVIINAKVGPKYVEILIRDNGLGMTPEEVENAFDPYFSAQGDGGHLGLSIGASIVEHLGGELSIDSVPGVGTRLSVKLLRSEPAVRTVRQPTPMARASNSPRVLLIDDEPNVLRGMSRVLSGQCDVTTAESGMAAIELLRDDQQFDAVLCDMMMPGMTGSAVLAWIEDHRPDLATRFAIVTGGAVGHEQAKYLKQAEVPVMRKPLSRSEILGLIDELSG